MDKNIFRKSSLDRLQSPEQLDKLLTVTSLKAWVALIGVAVLITAVIVWSIIGTMSINVYGRGMLVSAGGIQHVFSNSKGELTDISVQSGDYVESGDVVARLAQPELIEHIKETEQKLNKLEENSEEYEALHKTLETLKNELYLSSRIVSPYSGKVMSVNEDKGDFIEKGSSVISMEGMSDNLRELEVLLYVSADEGKKVHQGMEVKIEPTSVMKEEYGYLLGKVIDVADYPSSFEDINEKIGNENLAEAIAGEGVPIQVTISLIPDNQTESGFKWTTTAGPPVNIQSGTLTNGIIAIEKIHPISKLLPNM